jgi:hypothetical protein
VGHQAVRRTPEAGKGNGVNKENLFGFIEKYGFAVFVATALGVSLREDVIKPLVAEHTQFVKSVIETQKEIAKTVSEQTKLLYALQPRATEIAE